MALHVIMSQQCHGGIKSPGTRINTWFPELRTFVKVQMKTHLLSHWKQPFPFSPFSSFLDFQIWFLLPYSLLFFWLWSNHIIWDCHCQRARTKQLTICLYWSLYWIFLVNTLFPGFFLFVFSFLFSLSSFENREKTKGKRQIELWV